MSAVRCPSPDCGWRGDVLEAVPAPDQRVLCPECGEEVEPADHPLPPPPPRPEPS